MNKKLLFIAIVGVVIILAVIIYFATSSTPDPEEANNTGIAGNTTTGNTTTGNTNTGNTNTGNTNGNTTTGNTNGNTNGNTTTGNTTTGNTNGNTTTGNTNGNTTTGNTNGNTTTGNTTTGNTTTGNTTTGKTVACVKYGTNGQPVTLQQAYDMVNSSSSLHFGTHTQMDRLAKNEGVTWCNYMWMVNADGTTATRGPDLLLSGLPFKAGMPSTYVVGSSTEWPGCGVHDRTGIFYINAGTSVSTVGDAKYHTFISVDGNKTAAEINSLLPTGYAVATGSLAPRGINTNQLLKYLP